MQSAYKQYHSTETALIKVHNDILWAMERQGVTILILLDLSSAFDTIDHEVLLHRLEYMLGVHGTPLAWFRSYVSGRSQRVLIDGKFSSVQSLIYGVPQGSVLGPLLFVIYILPLGELVRQFDLALHIYADDTQVYFSVCPTTQEGVDQAASKIEDCVNKIQTWMSQNFLKLNADKTEVIVFGFRTQLSKFHLPSITIAGVNVPVQNNPVRNLGVFFDSGLTMTAQVANVIKATNYHLLNISRARKMLTNDAAKIAVHTLVTSRLDYCNSLLAGINKTLLSRLQNVQRTAARIITRRRKYDSVTSELISLHWLPVEQRIKFKVLLLVYKSLHNQAPSYISQLLQMQPSRRQLRSSSSSQLVHPRTHRSTFADRSFSCFGPKQWNSLPSHIREAGTVDIFKKLLKFHLFHEAYSQ